MLQFSVYDRRSVLSMIALDFSRRCDYDEACLPNWRLRIVSIPFKSAFATYP